MEPMCSDLNVNGVAHKLRTNNKQTYNIECIECAQGLIMIRTQISF